MTLRPFPSCHTTHHSHLALSTASWGAGMANTKSKSYKKMKMQAKGMGMGMAKAQSDSDKELTGPKQKNCAWQAFITGRQYNVAYPDTQAVYQVRER